jgi:putative transposase
MRFPRKKIEGKGCYYHVSNHVSGIRGALPFKSEDKNFGFSIVEKLQKLYFAEVVSMCWMGNHFHLVVYMPGEVPSLDKAVERYNKFYKSDPYHHPPLNMKKNRTRCKKIAQKLIDLSEFMRSFQQRYTCWFNKKTNRQGPLWKSRFWSCILEGSLALWECVKYVEMNPVRAEIVDNPKEYQFCTWGKGKKHPFKKFFVKHMSMNAGYRKILFDQKNKEKVVFDQFGRELQNILCFENRITKLQNHRIYKEAQKNNNRDIFRKFLMTVNDWSVGMIIGSREFVEKTALKFYNPEYVKKKRKNYGTTDMGITICSFHKGRHYVPGKS